MKEAGKPAAPDRGVRLQAFLASRGVASRRACEEIIRAGRVSVDGYTAEGLGQRVTLGAKVLVDGQPVGSEARKRYLALHKPKGILSSMSDPHGRPVAVDLLRPEVQERVYNVGRLDYDSSGLLLFTNDGEFARIVGHPSGNVEKEYRVRTGGPVSHVFSKAFLRGIPDHGQILRALRCEPEGDSVLRIVMVEGRNREIRRALAAFGFHAVDLVRIRVGAVTLDGLAPGAWRDLSDSERLGLLGAGRVDGSVRGLRP